jgi:hypothetical protein
VVSGLITFDKSRSVSSDIIIASLVDLSGVFTSDDTIDYPEFTTPDRFASAM